MLGPRAGWATQGGPQDVNGTLWDQPYWGQPPLNTSGPTHSLCPVKPQEVSNGSQKVMSSQRQRMSQGMLHGAQLFMLSSHTQKELSRQHTMCEDMSDSVGS